MLISIVIPCYYSQDTIRKEVELILEEFSKREDYSCEIILVNDGSKDATFDIICELCNEHNNIKGINLMRGFGQQNAQMAGLSYCKGEYIMGMDDDLQTHPSQMFKLIEKIREGYDVVYGEYPKSKNGFFKQLSSNFNKFTARIFLDMPKDIVATNYWIISDVVCKETLKYSSFNPVLDAIFYQVTHNFGRVDVDHYKRDSGKSGYTFRKLVRLWLSYWNYSIVPLRISFIIGFLSATFGLCITIWLFYKKITDPTIPMGWASTLCLMTLLFGAVLMVLGVVGEYLGKAILILNKTPQYIVREEINAEKQSSAVD